MSKDNRKEKKLSLIIHKWKFIEFGRYRNAWKHWAVRWVRFMSMHDVLFNVWDKSFWHFIRCCLNFCDHFAIRMGISNKTVKLKFIFIFVITKQTKASWFELISSLLLNYTRFIKVNKCDFIWSVKSWTRNKKICFLMIVTIRNYTDLSRIQIISLIFWERIQSFFKQHVSFSCFVSSNHSGSHTLFVI